MTKPKKTKAVEPLRDPNAKERAAIAEARAAHENFPLRTEMKINKGAGAGVLDVGPKHSDSKGTFFQLQKTFATASPDFASAQLLALSNVLGLDECRLNAAFALVDAVGAKDELEAALATQIAASHSLAMDMLGRTKTANTVPALTTYGNLATKFQRTMLTAIGELTKLRTGGVQTVRHVHISENGQAIIADQFHHHSGGQANGTVKQPYEPFASGPLASGSALPGQDTGDREAVPASGIERAQTVQASRIGL